MWKFPTQCIIRLSDHTYHTNCKLTYLLSPYAYEMTSISLITRSIPVHQHSDLFQDCFRLLAPGQVYVHCTHSGRRIRTLTRKERGISLDYKSNLGPTRTVDVKNATVTPRTNARVEIEQEREHAQQEREHAEAGLSTLLAMQRWPIRYDLAEDGRQAHCTVSIQLCFSPFVFLHVSAIRKNLF